eukprot:GHVU01133887.1.p1 GENE.GHVU01133887.1~~GHVU01133887.1.p1  ORF type:complete len:203 (-),score=8.67 GHVU01133887.1:498-1106(-)
MDDVFTLQDIIDAGGATPPSTPVPVLAAHHVPASHRIPLSEGALSSGGSEQGDKGTSAFVSSPNRISTGSGAIPASAAVQTPLHSGTAARPGIGPTHVIQKRRSPRNHPGVFGVFIRGANTPPTPDPMCLFCRSFHTHLAISIYISFTNVMTHDVIHQIVSSLDIQLSPRPAGAPVHLINLSLITYCTRFLRATAAAAGMDG